MSDPFVCARCARLGTTCCEITTGSEELCFPLSDYERERILKYAPDNGGFALEANSAVFIENLYKLFPDERRDVNSIFPAGEFHYRLAVNDNGACVFLGSEGCTLARDIRPFYCRIFPFWVIGKSISVLESSDCLAQTENKTPGGMIRSVCLDLEEILNIYGQLRTAWGFKSYTF
ncbi:YkgJ family cysteine cluster protein [Maridesulfovibrio bastinii]|uniref:YkgJ family cysteine cluster protein n=1 Tax=Maridesulfovibrio bastinii TaxID=47157 RepID=UPI000483EC27|nr:hypothetical protein [Maridesulfovibrio bastinii]